MDHLMVLYYLKMLIVNLMKNTTNSCKVLKSQ